MNNRISIIGKLGLLGWPLLLAGCATEPNLTDIQKQIQMLTVQQEATQKYEQQTLERLGTIESQLDEHDFLVGELIKTEEEASLDTRHLLDKLERTSAMLREQIEQTRTTTQRRDQDLSIRVKALESRLDNMVHQPRSTPTETVPPAIPAPPPAANTGNGSGSDSSKPPETPAAPNAENEASAFRAAYKTYLNGNYDRATVEFQRFVKHYPDTTLTPQAFYYLGESLYFQKHYDPAKQTLEHVVANYPNNKYRISALYKLGQLMLETDQRPKAQEYWNRVIQEFPESPEATHAKEQLKKSGLS